MSQQHLLIEIDHDDDETNSAAYLLLALDDTTREVIRSRLVLYGRAQEADPDAVIMAFTEKRLNLNCFSRPDSDHPEYQRLPAELLLRARVPEDTPSHAGLRLVAGDDPGEGVSMSELTCYIAEEGLYWRAYHDGDCEMVSAPVTFPVLARLLHEQ
jgi:hypothetical protein